MQQQRELALLSTRARSLMQKRHQEEQNLKITVQEMTARQ